MNVGARIRQARKEQGLRREDLAEAACVSFGAIQFYEQGRRIPRLPVLERIAEVTGKTVAWFYEAEERAEVKA